MLNVLKTTTKGRSPGGVPYIYIYTYIYAVRSSQEHCITCNWFAMPPSNADPAGLAHPWTLPDTANKLPSVRCHNTELASNTSLDFLGGAVARLPY